MLDIAHLRSTVTTGQYVVDPHAVADALLSHAGIAIPSDLPAKDTGDRAVSPPGARSPATPPPRNLRG